MSPVRFLFISRLMRQGAPEFVEAARLLRRVMKRGELNILGLDTNPAAVKQAQLDEWEGRNYQLFKRCE